MNKMCKTPIQSATDMLNHMAVHKWYRNSGLANYRAEPTAKSVS